MYVANQSDVSWRKVEDEIILIHLGSNFYYSLNETGSRLWERLTKSERDLDDCVAELVGEFEATPEKVRKDVAKLLKQLAKEKLVIAQVKKTANGRAGKGRPKRIRAPYAAPLLTKFDKLEKLLICGE